MVALAKAGSIWASITAAARRFDLERRLALFLAVSAVVSGVLTYVVITGTPIYGGGVQDVVVLLNLDLILLLLLVAVIARRIVRLIVDKRQRSAGSRLHMRLVGLFSVVAALPAILVAIFSAAFLSSGLETWFSVRVRSALDNSLAVAEAYLAEHREVIRGDALAMAADLNREGMALLEQPSYLRQIVSAQAALRALSEAVVFDNTGRVVASAGLGLALGFEGVPESAMEEADRGEVVTVTSDSDDRIRALVRLDGFGGAYLYIGRLVDPKVLVFTERTQAVVQEYRLVERERSGIQITSALIFIMVAVLLMLAAVWLGMNFADRLAAPISRLIAAAERVRGGDLLARVPEDIGVEDEVATLGRAFNRMTSQLESQRRELVETNRELDERRQFTEAVLTGVTAGVVGLDAGRRVVLPNASALALLERSQGELLGQPVIEAFPEIAPLFDRLEAAADSSVEAPVTLVRHGSQRMLLARLAAQEDEHGISGYVLTFDDLTELLSAQRQAAWSEVARRIAHEIKNPLTPIRLSAERLGRRFGRQVEEADRESFARSVDTIVRQVDTIGLLVSEFSAFARMPAAVMRNESLAELVRAAVHLQQVAWPQITFVLELPPDDPLRLDCDAGKINQALTNLLTNAVNALSEQPDLADKEQRIIVRGRRAPAQIVLQIEDGGPGFPEGDRARLLEPYVTTRSKGTGLGLAIVRKIMEEHNGKIELADAPEGGAIVRLTFPGRAVA